MMAYVARLCEVSERVEEVFQKAECFTHYAYVTSNQKFMLLDIQGSEYSLYDPETANQEHCDDEDEYYFCCGNLSSLSINNFLKQHKYNKFYKMIINSKKIESISLCHAKHVLLCCILMHDNCQGCIW